MKLIHKITIFLTFTILFLTITKTVAASEEFIVDTNVEYTFLENGRANVSYKVEIENRFATLAPKTYSISLNKINVDNIHSYSNGQDIPVLIERNTNDETNIKINFPKANTGRGISTDFTINFESDSFTTHTGEVWELSLPKLENKDEYRNYNVTFIVPNSFGEKAYVSPTPVSQFQNDNSKIYTFNKDSVSAGSIIAAFGDFQVFDFKINYHLQNPLLQKAQTEIALPPDTSIQKVFYTSIQPLPENVYQDVDGNWIAKYILGPREKIDVETVGSVQLFAMPIYSPNGTSTYLQKNLVENEYWEVKNPKIKNISKNFTNAYEIYNYVVNTLDYNLERVAPNTSRIGALKSLDSPQNAICMEFTDLFVTLARASGIPAREINGFAYSENSEVQPLSLVADVLHAWPQYWDFNKKEWISVDPTWADTTGGLDFFAKNDLRHFTFVIHGTSSTKPYPPGSYKLGTNPTKDVFVEFGKLPETRKDSLIIKSNTKNDFLFFKKSLNIIIENRGTASARNIKPTIIFGQESYNLDEIEIIPPYGKAEMEFTIPYNFLTINNPEKVIIKAADTSVEVPSNKETYILVSFLLICFVSILILTFFFVRMKKITILKFLNR